ncbi:MAG TPA: hypothetical protein VFR24_18030 [Candidatus Angelobacter sp.]|nr:hypothetical protein [Candidatus Angelobacter sp.]
MGVGILTELGYIHSHFGKAGAMQEKFDRWFKRVGALIWAVVGVIVAAIFRPLVGAVWPAVSAWIVQNPKNLEATVQFVQAVLVLVLYGWAFRYQRFVSNDGAFSKAGAFDGSQVDEDFLKPADAAKSFYRWWHNWWPILSIFYFVLGAKALRSEAGDEYIWNLFLNLLINIGSFFILVCYFALMGWESKSRLHNLQLLFFWVFVLVSGLNVLSFTYAHVHILNQWPQKLFMIGSGLANGVAFALLVGRFESKYIGAPQWVLVLLYVYSVMQATYGLFHGDLLKSQEIANGFRTAISIIVLFLKFVLFGWVIWMLKNRRLTVYLENISSLARKAQDEWSKVNSQDRRGEKSSGAAEGM